MKRMFIIFITIISIFLVSCSTSDSSAATPTTEKPAQTMAVTETTTEAATEATEAGQLGDYIVKYVKHEVAKDYEGNPALVVYSTFKNNSDEAVAFMFAVMPKAFQNGVELESTVVTDEIKEYTNSTKEIKPGVEINVCSIYKLDDKTSDVEFEITELISFDDSKIVETLKLS